MAHQWKAGDLAVCVDASPSEEGYAPPELTEGQVYTVYSVGIDQFGAVGLFLDELDSQGYAGGYLASRFRPVTDAMLPHVRQLVEA